MVKFKSILRSKILDRAYSTVRYQNHKWSSSDRFLFVLFPSFYFSSYSFYSFFFLFFHFSIILSLFLPFPTFDWRRTGARRRRGPSILSTFPRWRKSFEWRRKARCAGGREGESCKRNPPTGSRPANTKKATGNILKGKVACHTHGDICASNHSRLGTYSRACL